MCSLKEFLNTGDTTVHLDAEVDQVVCNIVLPGLPLIGTARVLTTLIALFDTTVRVLVLLNSNVMVRGIDCGWQVGY